LNPAERILFLGSALLATAGGLQAGLPSLLWGGAGAALFILLAVWRLLRGYGTPLFLKTTPSSMDCVIS
jgi:hypothetical protein